MALRLGEPAPPHHALVAAGLVSSLALGLSALLPPTGLPFGGCALLSWTGLPCPTCGATRTFVHLAHGRVVEGIALNPGAALLFATGVTVLSLVVLRATVLRRRVEWTLDGMGARRVRIAGWSLFAANWAWLVIHGVG